MPSAFRQRAAPTRAVAILDRARFCGAGSKTVLASTIAVVELEQRSAGSNTCLCLKFCCPKQCPKIAE